MHWEGLIESEMFGVDYGSEVRWSYLNMRVLLGV